MMPDGRTCGSEGARTGRVTLGLFLIGLGVVFLLRNLGLVSANVFLWIWPLALAGAGLYNLLRAGHRTAGVWVLAIGVLVTLHQAQAASLRDTWPFLVVTAGLAMIVGAFDPRRDTRQVVR
jgi:Domain of unknown function (DUF5668)